MNALFDVLLYIVILGTALLIITALTQGIYKMCNKIKRLDKSEQLKENNRADMRRKMARHV